MAMSRWFCSAVPRNSTLPKVSARQPLMIETSARSGGSTKHVMPSTVIVGLGAPRWGNIPGWSRMPTPTGTSAPPRPIAPARTFSAQVPIGKNSATRTLSLR